MKMHNEAVKLFAYAHSDAQHAAPVSVHSRGLALRPLLADKRRRSRLDGRLCLCCAALDGYRHRAVLALRELLGRKKLQLLYLQRESRLLLQPSVQHRGPQGM